MQYASLALEARMRAPGSDAEKHNIPSELVALQNAIGVARKKQDDGLGGVLLDAWVSRDVRRGVSGAARRRGRLARRASGPPRRGRHSVGTAPRRAPRPVLGAAAARAVLGPWNLGT